jgi:hypothetical protein
VFAIISLFFGGVLATAASAECYGPSWFRDALGRAPLSVGDQCDFANAGGWRWTAKGGPITAFGDSLVAQKVTTLSCARDEEIWVADCQTGEVVTFLGTLCRGPASTAPYSTVRCFDGVGGLLKMSQSSTLSQLVKAAEESEITMKTGTISDQFGDFPFNRRPNPACGCKLYYPDSPGAKL